MDTHSAEPFLIGFFVLLTAAAGYFLLRNIGTNATQESGRMITGFLGVFLLMGGAAKFFEPFTSLSAHRIALSGLPFPVLSNWAGKFGGISTLSALSN